MKKILFLTVYLLCVSIISLFSQNSELDSIINVNISLKELSNSTPDKLDKIIVSEKYIILEGIISSIREIERSENNFIIDLHLLNGEWIGMDRIDVYKCIINVDGKEWENRFPKRAPREPTEELILLNNQVMVIGKVTDYVMDNSILTAVVNAEYIRKIQ
ncbi:MAG: hypothetical protein JEY91_00110 [Spirochaetaceae bacterium]|nr:hypothetical protein [Spirochaetaceae bacterium]